MKGLDCDCLKSLKRSGEAVKVFGIGTTREGRAFAGDVDEAINAQADLEWSTRGDSLGRTSEASII